MAFVTGLILLDAPASALNNSGANTQARTENAVATKFIGTRQGPVPYVSAQAFRYWLRTTLENNTDTGWRAAPVFREQKVAYTDANPLEWWDDDLFGYMRAQSRRAEAARQREAAGAQATGTATSTEITRVSPLRVSTLVSIAPVSLVDDFGTMSRQDADPVPHEHQFYRTVLKGLLSLDLHAAGTFSYRNRTGFRNLDDTRVQLAQQRGLIHVEVEQSYRMPDDQRSERIAALLRGLGLLTGGAKQTIHYTDVTPTVMVAMVTRGGNNPLQYLIGTDTSHLPHVHTQSLIELVRVWGDQILSPVYVGWVQGFQDQQRERLMSALDELSNQTGEPRLPHGYRAGHPREVLDELAQAVRANAATWLA